MYWQWKMRRVDVERKTLKKADKTSEVDKMRHAEQPRDVLRNIKGGM